MRNENVITGKTRVCGLIGYPVGHSMSPAMHNAAFRELGLDYVYVTFPVREGELGTAVTGMKALSIQGVNVTVPHKVAVVPLLDELDPLAQKIGAVNTVVNDDGCLRGSNTDAGGFLQPLLERGIDPRGRRVVLLGAGGAARAVSFILAERGAQLALLNRQPERAIELARVIFRAFHHEVSALELNVTNLENVLGEADILVNATSVGMTPNDGDSPVPAGLLRRGLVVYDIIYNPVQTRLLREAEAAGALVIGGLDMLVWQGALAFEQWTGREAPRQLMKDEAIKALTK